jgi:beta-glucosidase
MKFRKLLLAFVPALLAAAPFHAAESAQIETKLEAKYLRDYPQIDSIVAQMTLEEKVHMLHANGNFYSGGADRFGFPEVAHSDGPLGVREELVRDGWAGLGLDNDYATYFPACSAVGATWNKQIAERDGVGIGSEARARNKDILLTPAVNIMRSPLCGRTYEYFSEDPFLTKRLAVPMIIGIQNQDVAASVKHFAVNNQETYRDFISSEADERTLREIYLPAFKAAVQEAGSFTVMGAYNKFRGESLCQNGYMLNKILRDDWGFQGIVVSDWSATHDTVKAALNGLDIEMGTLKPYNEFYFADPLLKAVKDGTVPESVIDDKVKRIFKVLLNSGKCNPDRKKGSLATDFQTKIAYDTAAESIILLENKNHALPLNLKKIKSVAVIGDNADYKQAAVGFGAGVKAAHEITPLQGIKSSFGPNVDVRYAQGYEQRYEKPETNDYKGLFKRRINYSINQELFDEAVKLASECDVAIVVGGSNRMYEVESADRPDLKLPYAQEALIKAIQEVNPNTVVVLIAGGAFDINNLSETANGLLWMSFNGSENGNALGDVLCGKVNPSGKLPFTIPHKLEDLGVHALNAFPGEGDTVDYKEGIYVGYRWLDKHGIDPLYEFGYGLSYTNFSLGTPEISKTEVAPFDTIEVTVPVSNIGSVNGKEVVQLYVGKPDSKIDRAVRELKGFEKLSIAAGETEMCKLRVPVSELAYWDVNTNQWIVEKGDYEIYLGNSSRNLTKILHVTVNY